MTRACLAWLLVGQLLLAVQGISGLRADEVTENTLKPGDQAPHFEKLKEFLAEQKPDIPQKGPVLLLFIKEYDLYSARTIEQLKNLENRNTELLEESHMVVVLTRNHGTNEFDRSVLPERWYFLNDTEDIYYTSYRIIATPTAVVISEKGVIVGFHAGYSPGLMAAIQRNLLMELRGTDAVRTAAPATSAELQIGRRLAGRGLWERALPYYRAAAEKEPLDPPALLEMARILVEMEEVEEALQILDGLEDMDGLEDLRRRALEIRGGEPEEKAPTTQ